jgi:hypothetical protein
MTTEFKLNYDSNKYLEDLEKQFQDFKTTLECIGDISPGDKLARSDDAKYYIHAKSMMFNGVRRWWNNQSRERIVDFLKEDFECFMKFLDNFLRKFRLSYTNKEYVLSDNILLFVNKIMFGLYNLKETYPNERKMICQVDSIILTFIDFKTNLNELKNYRSDVFNMERHNSE